MVKTKLSAKRVIITGFALFSMLFGGGNFILPPLLGLKAGDSWGLVSFAFGISGVIIPLLAILIMAKNQNTMVDLGRKIHSSFGLILGVLMFGVCLSFPIPRTASVTYELAVQDYTSIDSLSFTALYFLAVAFLSINRSKVFDILGKYLTPVLLAIIAMIIIKAVFFTEGNIQPSTLESPFSTGLLEGYQTFDGMAAMIYGGLIVSSLNLDSSLSMDNRLKLAIYSGLISCFLLFLVYTGFIYTGAILREQFDSVDVSRTEALNTLSFHTLGSLGRVLLNISVSIACFTSAVGIVTSAAVFMKQVFRNSPWAYHATVIASCLLGVLVGHTGTENIIKIAIPVLVLIYPIIVMLIFLNLAPEKWTSKFVFRAVIGTSILFALPDFLGIMGFDFSKVNEMLPLSEFGLGWLIPSFMVWGVTKVFDKNNPS